MGNETRQLVLAKNSLDTLIDQLFELFRQDNVDIHAVREILDSYNSTPAEWKKYAKFHPERYTRNLVVEGPGFNLMVVCWGSKQGSPIHDHTKAHCIMKILEGSLSEVRYAPPKEENNNVEAQLVEMSRKILNLNDTCYINDSIGLHRVENEDDEPCVSLHIYSPPFSYCNSYDEDTGAKCRRTLTFWTKFGRSTSESTMHF